MINVTTQGHPQYILPRINFSLILVRHQVGSRPNIIHDFLMRQTTRKTNKNLVSLLGGQRTKLLHLLLLGHRYAHLPSPPKPNETQGRHDTT